MKNRLKAVPSFGAAILCATILITPRTAFAEPKTGKDYPNEKCDRQNKDGTTTTGQCSNVCKDLEVSTVKDVNTGHRTCKEKARIVADWGLVVATGNPSVVFWRYNSAGEVQACGPTSTPDELECRPVTIRQVEAKSVK